MSESLEELACTSYIVQIEEFNPQALLPHGLTIQQLYLAMTDFTNFLGFVNQQLFTKQTPRLEIMLMPANFSSLVGEFIVSAVPKYCPTLVKNQYHNGHPDLIPAQQFPGNRVQHAQDGIEVKSSRYLSVWQGHNPEDSWLMVFVFDSNRPRDETESDTAKPFRFVKVVGAQLTASDWSFSGRSATSRRTITASVTASGYKKMTQNWIYQSSSKVS